MSLLIESITKRFGDIVALDDVSFGVEPGRIFGLLGPNGAGKTTLMRILATAIRASYGSASVDGIDLGRDALRRTLEATDLRPADFDIVDAYSCFPVVPKLLVEHLGLPRDTVPSVTRCTTSYPSLAATSKASRGASVMGVT